MPILRAAALRHWLVRRHRQLAVWIALPVLAWALTGMLHPLMARWQPSAAAMQPPAAMLAPPPGTTWSGLPAPATVLPDTLPLRELRAVTWQGKAYWMAQSPSGAIRYFDAGSGAPADIERALAEALARHYTGEKQATIHLSHVTTFSDEYPFVNRYLPVWRVAFDRPDGLVAFIEPRHLLLTALTDTWKTRFSWLFSNLHSWKWWSHETSRDIAMVIMLGLILALLVTGVVRASAGGSSQRPPLRHWHRRAGLVIVPAVLAWCASAIFHVLHINKSHPAFATHPLTLAFKASELTQPAPAGIPPTARLQVLATVQGPLWHWYTLQAPESAHPAHPAAGQAGHAHQHAAAEAPVLRESYVSAHTGNPVMPVDHFRALTRAAASGAHWLASEPVTRFTPEYGFVQKRLPVYKISFSTPDHLAVYVDPSDAAIAAVIRDADRTEGFSFAYLHKLAWLDAAGKNFRDLVAVVLAATVLGLTTIGLLLRRTLRRTG